MKKILIALVLLALPGLTLAAGGGGFNLMTAPIDPHCNPGESINDLPSKTLDSNPTV
jgi:hypothetical protein